MHEDDGSSSVNGDRNGEEETYPIEDDTETQTQQMTPLRREVGGRNRDEDVEESEQQTYPLSVPGTPASVTSQRSLASQRSQQSTQSYGSHVSNRFSQGGIVNSSSSNGRSNSVMNTPSSVASSRRGGKLSQQTPTIMGTPRTPTRRTPQGSNSNGGLLPSYSRSPYHHSQPFLPRGEFGHNHRTSSQRYQSTPNSNAPSSPGDSSPGSERVLLSIIIIIIIIFIIICIIIIINGCHCCYYNYYHH